MAKLKTKSRPVSKSSRSKIKRRPTRSSSKTKRSFSWSNLKKSIGPGLITGGSDNDPAGIVTYSLAGSLLGYATLWVLLLVTPLMITLQEMAGRVAIIQKKGLASIIKNYYGFRIAAVAVLILVIANIATIAADLAGVASVLGLIFGVNFLYFIAPITLIVSLAILFESYSRFKKLMIGLTFLLVLYVFSAVLARPDWTEVARGLIPTFDNSLVFLGVIVGIVGTTISPYMLFWQASEEVEEHHRVLKPKELTTDTVIGMVWSNLVAIFIIIAAGATLFSQNITINSITDISLALEPLANDWSYALFSIGIIISGFIALPILSGSTAYAVSELADWREGLNKKVHLARGFYLVITLSMIFGALVAFLPINPIDFLYYTQILNGFLMPILILILLALCNNPKVVGKKYVNGPIKNSIAIISLIILVLLDIFLLLSIF